MLTHAVPTNIFNGAHHMLDELNAYHTTHNELYNIIN